MAKSRKSGPPAVATHRRARYDYEILETVEAGIALVGPEVKSIREGRINLRESFATVRGDEIYLLNAHVSPYEPATRQNPEDPARPRKLLLHRSQIEKWKGKVAERGLTIVPLQVYFSNGRAKVELGLARGKHTYDKRQALRRREDERSTRRALRAHRGRANDRG